MENLLKFDEVEGCVITVEELTDSTLQQARTKGWSLRGVFESARRLDRYGSKEGEVGMFGVFSIPLTGVVATMQVTADNLLKELQDTRSKQYAAEQNLKLANEKLAGIMLATAPATAPQIEVPF